MRIEKINEHQIRCTLNQKDLKEREIRISELAYGTEKAKALFRDMMQQASYEFGFEADDIPLMIEAIPMLPDALVLVITKVEDPEELDTRFSHFTDDPEDDYFDEEDFVMVDDEDIPFSDTLTEAEESYSSDTLSFHPESLSGITEGNSEKDTDFISLSEALGIEPRPKTERTREQTDIIRVYRFHSLKQLSTLGEQLLYQYHGQNTAYRNKYAGEYYLILHKSDHSPEEFNRICNTISEYGTLIRSTPAISSYYEEHYEPLIHDKALQILGSM
ncbi:MAG: adaptor protein MecA [Lachnospiraceae bacterium]|nr:adaptor protein MecA [Lachnospiraceae bacterium]